MADIYNNKDTFNEADEIAELWAQSWGFEDADALKDWGKQAECERLAALKAKKTVD